MAKPKRRKPRYYSSETVLEDFYEALASGDSGRLKRVHIPRSDVFYVREAYYQHTGNWETLDRIERAMYLEGILAAHDVLDPHRKRDWELGQEDVSVRPEEQEDT